MIDKDLIELQKGCKATGVIIENKDIELLNSKILISSNYSNDNIIKIFQEKIHNNKFDYLVIEEIDKLEIDKQDKYYQIIKDREFYGYKLPEDVIVVLSVKNKEGLKNISQKLYNLCVVVF